MGVFTTLAAIGSAVAVKKAHDKKKSAQVQSAASAAETAAEAASLKEAETRRKTLLKQDTETISTSPLGLAGSVDTTKKKKTLLGQ